ncbi:unnamed protein product [Rhizophagus irregularis]|nr:unnamed protein product [Rhizophagus irregularis]
MIISLSLLHKSCLDPEFLRVVYLFYDGYDSTNITHQFSSDRLTDTYFRYPTAHFSTATDWYFILHSTEVFAVLKDRVSDSEEPANKKRRVEEIIKKK